MEIINILSVVAIVMSTVISINLNDNTEDQEWIKFKTDFNKTYKTEKEELYRKKVFLENIKVIVKHNEMYKKGLESYELGINTYSDLTHQEFIRKMNGFKKMYVNKNHEESIRFSIPGNVEVPDVIDFRTKGYVTPVKNQRSCASGWAFSATGAIEGQRYRVTKHLLPLSVQNLIDCSSLYGNNGCEGGTVNNAFRYFSNEGINSDNSYPYEATDGKCRYNLNNTDATGHGFMIIPPNETALKTAIGIYGPISAVIDITPNEFKSYRSGVYHNANCSSTNVNHAVLVVGYGTDARRREYWIVKNSWGTSWGDNGYVLMARNENNNCGIASSTSVPLL